MSFPQPSMSGAALMLQEQLLPALEPPGMGVLFRGKESRRVGLIVKKTGSGTHLNGRDAGYGWLRNSPGWRTARLNTRSRDYRAGGTAPACSGTSVTAVGTAINAQFRTLATAFCVELSLLTGIRSCLAATTLKRCFCTGHRGFGSLASSKYWP